MGAATATAGVTGVRAWLATRGWAWVTPKLVRAATVGVVTVGVIVSSVRLG